MKILYNQPEPELEEAETPRVLYESTPVEERENPYITGELELMHVDEKYRIRPADLKPNENQLLTEIKAAFWQRRGDFLTYQEIMEWAKTGTTLCVRPDYEGKSNPRLTRMLNRLWKAGKIDKYRKGLWMGVDHGKWAGQITGKQFGITFWIW